MTWKETCLVLREVRCVGLVFCRVVVAIPRRRCAHELVIVAGATIACGWEAMGTA